MAGAFGTAFWWSLGMAAVSLFPGLALLRAERRARAARTKAADQPSVTPEILVESPT
jgi:hypothetical protein